MSLQLLLKYGTALIQGLSSLGQFHLSCLSILRVFAEELRAEDRSLAFLKVDRSQSSKILGMFPSLQELIEIP